MPSVNKSPRRVNASQLILSAQSDPDMARLRNYEKRDIVTLLKNLEPQFQQNITEQTLATSLYVQYNNMGFISLTIQCVYLLECISYIFIKILVTCYFYNQQQNFIIKINQYNILPKWKAKLHLITIHPRKTSKESNFLYWIKI